MGWWIGVLAVRWMGDGDSDGNGDGDGDGCVIQLFRCRGDKLFVCVQLFSWWRRK